MSKTPSGELNRREPGERRAEVNLHRLAAVHLFPGGLFHDLEVAQLASVGHNCTDLGQAPGRAESVGRRDLALEKVIVVPGQKKL